MGYISKKQREEIKQKFDGLCAYSGTPLEDDWQVDHVKPLVRNWFDGTSMFPDAHCDENLVPCQKIINHYKGSLDLETFRNWFLGGLHERMDKPKNPRTEKSKRKKEYLNKVASYFGITPTKPFNGTFYFESVGVSKRADFNDFDDYEDDEEFEGYSRCPRCGRDYDEIDHEYQLCSKCGWDAEKNEHNQKARREPTQDDYMNGEADILTGRWW